MKIYQHIIFSACITIALVYVIACQEKSQESTIKGSSTAVEEQLMNVAEATKKSNQEVVATVENIETKTKEVESQIEEKMDNAKEGIQEIDIAIEENTTQEENNDGISNNLLYNGDFKDGLSSWEKDGSINVIEENGLNIIEIIGKEKKRVQIWQTVNTISGHVYRLSFRAKADQKGAFAMFRDNEKKAERYLFVNPNKAWKNYSKDFISFKNGPYRIYLTCNSTGSFYFSKASLTEISEP